MNPQVLILCISSFYQFTKILILDFNAYKIKINAKTFFNNLSFHNFSVRFLEVIFYVYINLYI